MRKYVKPNLISLNTSTVLEYTCPVQNSNYFQVHFTETGISPITPAGQTTSDGSPLSYNYISKNDAKIKIVKAKVINNKIVIS